MMKYPTALFDNDGTPTDDLLGLLNLFQVSHDGTLFGIRDATQNEWYQEGKLRADIQEKHGKKREDAMLYLADLGFVQEVQAPRLSYLHAIVLGGTVVAVRKRLAFLCKEWERGVRFHNLHFVGSTRPLHAEKEMREVLFNHNNAEFPFDETQVHQPVPLPTNEIEMMAMVEKQSRSRLPWERTANFFSCPDVNGRHANTEDTLKAWNALSLTSGGCLLVSSQPFVSFQEIVGRTVISRRHDPVEAIGYGSNSLPVTVYLDNVAKVIYELCQP